VTVPPVYNKLRPLDFVNVCLGQMSVVYDTKPPGWDLHQLSCQSTGVTFDLKRTFGRIKAVRKAYPTAAVQFDRAAYASAKVTLAPFAPPSIHYKSLSLVREDDLRQQLTELAHSVHEEFKFNGEFHSPTDRDPFDLAKWTTAEWTLSTQMLPSRWAAQLERFPGVLITAISINPEFLKMHTENFYWTVQGVAYAS
jgi:hypothetical protein